MMSRRRVYFLFFALFLIPAKNSWGSSTQDLSGSALNRSAATSNSVRMGLQLQKEEDLTPQDRSNNRSRQEFLQRLGESSTYQDGSVSPAGNGLAVDVRGVSPSAPTVGVMNQPWWLYWKHKESGGPAPFDSQAHCGIAQIDEAGEVLKCWLGLHPSVLAHLVWEEVNETNGDVQTLPYSSWPAGKKAQLAEAVYQASQWLKNDLQNFSGTPLNDPPTNLLALNDWNYPCNHFSKDAAWKLYRATVAHSLALEIGGWVPWSFLEYSPSDRDILLNSKYFFKSGVIDCNTYDDEAQTEPKNYHYFGYSMDGRVIPTAPTAGFNFLVQNNLIRSNHLKTLTQLLQWSHQLSHYLGGYSTKNVEYYWNYRGGVPAIRVIEGSVLTDPEYINSFPGVHLWTAGCRGTTEFFRAVLRQVNIPVQVYQESCEGHFLPIFWTVQKALDHGDAPYSSTWINTPPISAQNLLISLPQFQEWVSSGVCPMASRQLAILAVKYVTDLLVSTYCEDLKEGLSHAQGKVFAFLSNFFTMADLNEKQLWSRMNEKALQLGLCTPPDNKKPGPQDSTMSSSGTMTLKPPP